MQQKSEWSARSMVTRSGRHLYPFYRSGKSPARRRKKDANKEFISDQQANYEQE